jgi:hypothetical protein
MKRFVEGTDRGQSTLFPECLDDWIDEDNPVHGARTADCSDQDVAPAVRMSLLTRFHRSKCRQHAHAPFEPP